MLQKIKDFMMPLAMLTGGIFYKVFAPCAFLTPYLIFFMLLFTFSKLSPKGIKLTKLHYLLVFIQLASGIIAYYLLRDLNPVLAHGALICLMAPTATSAAVLTGMLGGSVSFLTSFTLISNLGVAFIAPIFFSLGNVNGDISFFESVIRIFVKVFPLLILPLISAWTIRYTLPKVQDFMLKYSKTPFYLWSVALVLVTARTVNSLVTLPKHDLPMEFSLAGIALLICCLQFYVGKNIGTRFNNRIAAGQSLGQKNTILAIWMTQAFLNPVAALAPSCYILWQNIINSYQIWKADRKLVAQQIQLESRTE